MKKAKKNHSYIVKHLGLLVIPALLIGAITMITLDTLIKELSLSVKLGCVGILLLAYSLHNIISSKRFIHSIIMTTLMVVSMIGVIALKYFHMISSLGYEVLLVTFFVAFVVSFANMQKYDDRSIKRSK